MAADNQEKLLNDRSGREQRDQVGDRGEDEKACKERIDSRRTFDLAERARGVLPCIGVKHQQVPSNPLDTDVQRQHSLNGCRQPD